MNILAIDTSSKFISLVIARDGNILVRFFEPLGRELSAKLVPVIDSSLKKAKLSLANIDYFGAGLGPGSFTALRIGLAAMKGLVFPFNKPIAGISSLDVLASSVKEEGIVCPVVDARRGLVYSAIYEANALRRGRYLLVTIEELLKRIKIKKKITFLGDALPLYQGIIRDKLGKRCEFAKEDLWYPLPENLLERVREKIRQGKLTDSYKLAPIYLYPKECQIGSIARK